MQEMLLPYRAAFYSLVVKAAEAGNDPDTRDIDLCRQLFTNLLQVQQRKQLKMQ